MDFSPGSSSERSPKKSASSTKKTSFVISSTRLEVLVGGPYTRNGEEHPYGHVALRVLTPKSETIYDFGRYGKVWGIGNSKGEGILRVWSNFQKYIAGENATGRTTTGYTFDVTLEQANAVDAYFAGLISGLETTSDRGHMKQYRLAKDYDALSCNCTTMSVDGVRAAKPTFATEAKKFNEGNGLSRTERSAAWFVGWPDRIFMPADLANYIKSLTGAEAPNSTKIYQGGK